MAINNAAKECSKIIDKYLVDHPDIKFMDDYDKTEYILTEEDNVLSVTLIEENIINLN